MVYGGRECVGVFGDCGGDNLAWKGVALGDSCLRRNGLWVDGGLLVILAIVHIRYCEIPAYAGMVHGVTGVFVWILALFWAVILAFGGGGGGQIGGGGGNRVYFGRYTPVHPWTIPAKAGISIKHGRQRRLNYAAVGGT